MSGFTSSALFWLGFLLLNSVYCASFNAQAVPTTTYTTAGTTVTTPTTAYPQEGPEAPVWNSNLGQFILGPKYEKRLKEERNKTGRPSHRQYRPQPPVMCPPCPCMQQQWQMMPMYPQQQMYPQPMFPHPGMYPHPGMFPPMHKPEEDDDHDDEDHHDDDDHHEGKRARRSTSDDYWYGTGKPNAVLSQINMGYNAQMQMKDYLGKYGAPLHMGTINPADFNYPKDFSAFNQPAYYPAQNIKDNIVYQLNGPIEATPIGSLVGPLTGVPDAFSTLVLQTGFFRLVSVQKDGIMQISDVNTNVIYSINCNQQHYGGCQFLVPIKNQWDYPKFYPAADQMYVLTGLLDVTLTADATGTPTTLSAGTYKIDVIRFEHQFRMKDVTAGTIYYVDCKKQQSGRTCENLRKV